MEEEKPNRVKLGVLAEDNVHPTLCETERQLIEYFSGNRTQFALKLNFAGTDFQNKVWQALLTIPYGQTRSYSDIAKQIGNEKAVRAVGAANGRNPISIIAPCHRVIGAGGELTGFAGGLTAKKVLLETERILNINVNNRTATKNILTRKTRSSVNSFQCALFGNPHKI